MRFWKWLVNAWRGWRQADRLIFRYHNGLFWTAADPILLWRQLLNRPELNYDGIAAALDAGQEPESSQAIEALCQVFGLTRFDARRGAGLTDLEMLDMLGDFQEYLATVKKNISPGPTSPAPGESWSSISLAPQGEATNPSSDLPSTPPAPNAASATA